MIVRAQNNTAYTKQHGNCSRSLRVLSRGEALSLPDDCIFIVNSLL